MTILRSPTTVIFSRFDLRITGDPVPRAHGETGIEIAVTMRVKRALL